MLLSLERTNPMASHFKIASSNFYTFLPDSFHPTDEYIYPTNTLKDSDKTSMRRMIQDLFIMRKFNRTVPFHFSGSTKYIVKPHRISEACIHKAIPLNSSYVEVNVPYDVAAVHHYRSEIINPAVKEYPNLTDTSMTKFSSFFLQSKFYDLIKKSGYLNLKRI